MSQANAAFPFGEDHDLDEMPGGSAAAFDVRPLRGVGRPPGGPDRPLRAADTGLAAAAGTERVEPGAAGAGAAPRAAAWEVASAGERLVSAVRDLGTLASGVWAMGTDDLVRLLGRLDAVTAAADVAKVMVTRDAITRGSVSASQQATPGQWVQANAPSLDAVAAAQIGQVATACADQPRNALLQSLVASGAVTPRCAATALREAKKIAADLEREVDEDEILGWYLAAAQGDASSKDLRHLSEWLRGRFGSKAANQKGERAHGLNALDSATLPDGVKRYLLHLCPEYAAILDAALAPLSGPEPTVDPDTGEQVRDSRTPARRRAEALVDVVRRASAADKAGSATATTKLIVTMSLADLLAGVGTGVTREGELLDAGTLRRLACDADLIPAVLGTGSEILDWGRERRLFDGPLRAAIVARDRHCTFPGCGRRPTWCAAHHVIHWIDGGKTALLNAALLCERHHVIVHRDNLTATVSTAGVMWDITPHGAPPTSATGYPHNIAPPQEDGPPTQDDDPDDPAGPDDPTGPAGPAGPAGPHDPPSQGPSEGAGSPSPADPTGPGDQDGSSPKDPQGPEGRLDDPPDAGDLADDRPAEGPEPPEDGPPEPAEGRAPPDDRDPPDHAGPGEAGTCPRGEPPGDPGPAAPPTSPTSSVPPARLRCRKPWWRLALHTSAAPAWMRPDADDPWADATSRHRPHLNVSPWPRHSRRVRIHARPRADLQSLGRRHIAERPVPLTL